MNSFSTEQMLVMRYGFAPLIKLEVVANDYLPSIKLIELRRKARDGALPFPVVVTGGHKNIMYHVPLKALADWIDEQSQIAIDDFRAMHV